MIRPADTNNSQLSVKDEQQHQFHFLSLPRVILPVSLPLSWQALGISDLRHGQEFVRFPDSPSQENSLSREWDTLYLTNFTSLICWDLQQDDGR